MAWTAPATYTAATALTAATMNQQVRDNFLEMEVADATKIGSLFISTGANALGERVPGSQAITSHGSTTSTVYTDLTTGGVGPTVSVTIGTAMIVILTCQLYNTTSSTWARMSYTMTGSSSFTAADARSIGVQKKREGALSGTVESVDTFEQGSLVTMHTGLTAGDVTVVAKYNASSGSAHFQVRRLMVIPL